MKVAANPGRWVRIEGRVTVSPPELDADGAGTEHRLYVDGELLDEIIWRALHEDPEDRVFGHLRIEVNA